MLATPDLEYVCENNPEMRKPKKKGDVSAKECVS